MSSVGRGSSVTSTKWQPAAMTWRSSGTAKRLAGPTVDTTMSCWRSIAPSAAASSMSTFMLRAPHSEAARAAASSDRSAMVTSEKLWKSLTALAKARPTSPAPRTSSRNFAPYRQDMKNVAPAAHGGSVERADAVVMVGSAPPPAGLPQPRGRPLPEDRAAGRAGRIWERASAPAGRSSRIRPAPAPATARWR